MSGGDEARRRINEIKWRNLGGNMETIPGFNLTYNDAEPEEPPPPPVPKSRVPPRVKPKAKPKAEPTQVLAESAPKAKPKAKRAPKKPEPEDPEPVDRFQAFSNTDLIAEILARTEDRRMEQKRALYRSFLL